jgi:plasmid rolling circle replication initiator protein Rep
MKCLYEDLPKQIDEEFAPSKKSTEKLTDVYLRIGEMKRAGRVNDCATFLDFTYSDDDMCRLAHANFCKDTLCPQCAKRKSMKVYTQVKSCVDYLQKNEDKAFLFATLTVKNCSGDDLAATCKLLYDSYIRLMDLKRMRFIHGAFRALEITHDNEEFITRDMYYGNTKRHIKSRRKYYEERGLKIGDKNPNFDMFHPHLHIIWVVDKSYFHHSSDWIDNRAPKLELVKLWQKALNVDYAPRADIRACKSKDIKENILGINTIDLSSAVAEVAKYAVKSADYLGGSDELNDRTVKALLSATRGRRMFEFYGIFRKVRQLLKLDDIENGDLVHVETEQEDGKPVVLMHVYFAWNKKKRQYIHIGIKEEVPEDSTAPPELVPPDRNIA